MRTALLAAAALCLVGSACRNSAEPTQHVVVLNVDKIDVPASVSSTSALDVVLSVMTNPCQTFTGIDADRTSVSVKLTALGKDPEKGCTDLAMVQSRSYRIEPPFPPGTFEIIVDRGSMSRLIATVQVQ